MKRILTGDRPTGKLHLGHYLGTLENRLKLQHRYETFIMLADVQALTDNFGQPDKIHDSVYQVALDNLAVGLDPAHSSLFIQSMIPEIAELTIYFMNLVTLSRLERNPTVKAEMRQKGFASNVPVGFLNYPISEAADILIFRADLVPAGDDQQPMVELTREIVRKFNYLYGPTFVMPEIKLGRVPRLVGTDGLAKMSKSLGNVIYLSDSNTTVRQKVLAMYTDPRRIRPTDPGQIADHPVFTYLQAFCPLKQRAQLIDYQQRYTEGKVSDIEVKEFLASILNTFLDPIRSRREEYAEQPDRVRSILKDGAQRARQAASNTLSLVRQAMKITYF